MHILKYPNFTGNFDGDHKLQSETNESVIMGDLDLNHNGKKGYSLENTNKFPIGVNCPTQSSPNLVHFQTPYAMTNIECSAGSVGSTACEERMQLGQLKQLRGSPLKSVRVKSVFCQSSMLIYFFLIVRSGRYLRHSEARHSTSSSNRRRSYLSVLPSPYDIQYLHPTVTNSVSQFYPVVQLCMSPKVL